MKVQTASAKCWRASQVRWVGKGNRIAICITFSIFTSWGRLLTRKRKTVYTICMEMENFPFQICDVSTCGEVGAQNFHFKWLSVIIFSLQGVSREKKPSRMDGWTFSFVSADADVSLNASHPFGANPGFICIQIRSRTGEIEKKIETDRGAASIADWNINCPKVNFMHHNDRRTNTQCSAGPHPKPQGFSLLWHAYVEGSTREKKENGPFSQIIRTESETRLDKWLLDFFFTWTQIPAGVCEGCYFSLELLQGLLNVQ